MCVCCGVAVAWQSEFLGTSVRMHGEGIRVSLRKGGDKSIVKCLGGHSTESDHNTCPARGLHVRSTIFSLDGASCEEALSNAVVTKVLARPPYASPDPPRTPVPNSLPIPTAAFGTLAPGNWPVWLLGGGLSGSWAAVCSLESEAYTGFCMLVCLASDRWLTTS